VLALLIALLVGAIGLALVTLTTTETLLSTSHRHVQEVSYGAEAAVERALHDLATIADWSAVLAAPPANVMSTFVDGAALPRLPEGRTLDLAALTLGRQRESDARDGATAFGPDSPEWRLYAHAPLADLAPLAGLGPPVYLVVWVADDGLDGDGDPASDANATILVRGEAFGGGGARRAVEAGVARAGDGSLQLRTWRASR
jgi:hypothetical protein